MWLLLLCFREGETKVQRCAHCHRANPHKIEFLTTNPMSNPPDQGFPTFVSCGPYPAREITFLPTHNPINTPVVARAMAYVEN